MMPTDDTPKGRILKTLSGQLAQYAAYHRHPANIASHFIGIPMIVLAFSALLSRPGFEVAGVSLAPADLFAIGFSVFYLSLERVLGLLMTVLMGLSLWFGAWSASQSTPVWLAIGLGGFVAGWIIQFIGHWFEGRKPAFVDDLIGLVVGPLFVVAEALFLLGLRSGLKAEVERLAGPVRTVGAAG